MGKPALTRLLEVVRTQGSTPREVGAWMLLLPDGSTQGSVGGGQLEWQAMAWAQAMVAGQEQTRRFALGPSLGQCCGGVVHLRARVLDAPALQAWRARQVLAPTPLALFGAGHVGQALAQALQPLPFALRWIDSRADPGSATSPTVCPDVVDPVQDAVADLVAGTQLLVMTHSHAEDFEIVWAALERQRRHADLARVDLIGSGTKWRSFRQRLLARGASEQALGWVRCPIGLPGLRGKAPAEIAASVVAQLLLDRQSPAQP